LIEEKVTNMFFIACLTHPLFLAAVTGIEVLGGSYTVGTE
jgi:hypothetical protein